MIMNPFRRHLYPVVPLSQELDVIQVLRNAMGCKISRKKDYKMNIISVTRGVGVCQIFRKKCSIIYTRMARYIISQTII